MVVQKEHLYKVLSSYQNLGSTALSSIATSYNSASIHSLPSLLRWFLLSVPVVPVLLTFHVLFAASSTHSPTSARHFWFKSLVLTIFAAFGGSTLASILSGATPPLFTTGSNFMLGYIAAAWYCVHTLAPVRSLLALRPVRALLAFGATAAKARTIFSFVDAFVARFPGACAGAIVLGGLAGSGGSLFVTFERKLRLGAKAPSELSRPGWGFKSAYLASALYYVLTDPDEVLRGMQLPLRSVVAREDARFGIALALSSHAAIEALLGRHFNPIYFVESLFYAVARVDRGEDASDAFSAVSTPSSTVSSRSGPHKKPRSSTRTPRGSSNALKESSARQRR